MQTLLLAAMMLANALALPPPALTVGVGPDGLTDDPTAPYYVMVNLSEPEAPHQGPADPNDCAHEDRPIDAVEGVDRVREPIDQLPPDLATLGSVGPYVPRCVAVPLRHCDSKLGLGCTPEAVYVSYNVATGRYYVEVAAPFPWSSRAVVASMGWTGTTGAELTADCLGCPPPGSGG